MIGNYWYNKIVSGTDYLIPFVESLQYFEKQLDDAYKELKISVFLSNESAKLPGILAYRYNQLQELEAILKFLNIKLDAVRTKVFRRFFEAYNKSLTSRDAERFAEADDEVSDLMVLVNSCALVRNQFLGIFKGLEAKNWQITNLTKLKVAGFDDGLSSPD